MFPAPSTRFPALSSVLSNAPPALSSVLSNAPPAVSKPFSNTLPAVSTVPSAAPATSLTAEDIVLPTVPLKVAGEAPEIAPSGLYFLPVQSIISPSLLIDRLHEAGVTAGVTFGQVGQVGQPGHTGGTISDFQYNQKC